jgi:FKBP-type peptidyl-prolyl cis-trans isomerase FkpA
MLPTKERMQPVTGRAFRGIDTQELPLTNSLLRGAAALFMTATLALALPVAGAQSPTSPPPGSSPQLGDERSRASYMVGMDVAGSLVPVGPDLDLAAFERAIRHAFSGGEPLLAETEVQPLAQALMQRIAVRAGQAPAGTALPDVDRGKVGLLVGSDVGRSLAPIQQELDLPILLQAVRTMLSGGKPLLDEAEAGAVREAFSQRVQAKMEAEAAARARSNQAEGEAFLAANRTAKGVTTTPSGLQYMVLRQGAGARPRPADRVRVNYRGTLLDGTVFDSSYDRGEPADFPLGQVIPGWTEGLGLMPVGAKYRFWIPAKLAYGERGTPGGPIGPNATLLFDVELLEIL